MQELSDYKKRLKPTILAEAERSFCEYGIRAVKMDDIAQRLGISKRTLYEVYSNKEEVLVDVVSDMLDSRGRHMEEFVSHCDNVIDIVLEVLRLQIEFSASTHYDFFKDIQRYPAAENILVEYNKKQEKASLDFYKRGVEQGYFRSEIDYDVFRRILTGSLHTIRTGKAYQDLTYKQLFVNFLCVIFRGICTDSGRMRFETFIDKYIVE